ncbi:MAG: class I SAM-dependent methyltransferase [Lutibacter sp.]|nr:class I SAM-dependent methyltransferase [Lutibacter sp.]
MESNISIFDKNTLEYDNWFEKHSKIYQSEILALKEAIPMNKKGVEIGCGTGRFSFPFKINIGVKPSFNMSKLAEKKE